MTYVFGIFLALYAVGAHAAPLDSIFEHWVSTPSQLQLPITWEMTRSDFISNGVSSQSESFHEIWLLEIGPGFDMYLSSPRSREAVTGGRTQPGPLAQYLVLSDRALARLVGVPMLRGEDEAAPVREDLIAMSLGPTPSDGHEYIIKVTKEEFYTILINFGV